MERIGDHAADIAELIIRDKRDHIYELVKYIPKWEMLQRQWYMMQSKLLLPLM